MTDMVAPYNERIDANGRAFYSVRWLARDLGVEAGTIRRLLQQQLTWPVPFYQAKPKDPLYVDMRNIERIREAARRIEARGVTRRSKDPIVGNIDRRWAEALRLELVSMNLWTPEERVARGMQIRDKHKNVCNPPLAFPAEEGLFDTIEQPSANRIGIMCDNHMIACLLRHHKHQRPSGNESTEKMRRRLMQRQAGRCGTCGELVIDDGRKTEVDHKRGMQDFVNSVMARSLSLDQAFDLWWDEDNLRVVHKKCNQTTRGLAHFHKRDGQETVHKQKTPKQRKTV